MHERSHDTHKVFPSPDGLAKLLEDVRRARQGEVRVLADHEVAQAAHAGEAVTEADDSLVNGGWSVRAHLRRVRGRRAVVDGHVEFLEHRAELCNIEESWVGALGADTAHPATELGVPPEAVCEQRGLLVRAQGDVAVEGGGSDPEPGPRDEEGGNMRRYTEVL